VTNRRFFRRQEVTPERRNSELSAIAGVQRVMALTNKKGEAMNSTKKLALVVLAMTSLSGCATTRTEMPAAESAAPAAPHATQYSRPAASYGSMGGYRYRRVTTVTLVSSS
jgi:hypothetical protein